MTVLTTPLTRTSTIELRLDAAWVPVCDVGLLTPGRGVAALLPDGRQVAVFLDRQHRIHAIGNRDPFSGAYVLSRGLVGSVDGQAFVSSPLHKQRFDLTTGRCLDDEAVTVPVFPARVRDHGGDGR